METSELKNELTKKVNSFFMFIGLIKFYRKLKQATTTFIINY